MFDFGVAYLAGKAYEFNNRKERERQRRPRR